jgi:hypothetical protein
VRLDRLRLQLRRRTEWEALELGRAMLRAWSGPVYRAWCATYLPFAVMTWLVLWPWPEFAGLVVFWCKPVFDRVLLHVFSQCAFGVSPSVRDVYRALPSILRRSGLLAWLTVYRFGLARSFVLPIWLLERQRGQAARVRSRLLRRRTGPYAAWLTLTCAAMGATITVSQVLTFEWLIPIGRTGLFSWEAWSSASLGHTALVLLNVFGAAAACVTEPLYIASGFSLYLNRRAELEAWDVEVQFRSLAERRPSEVATASVGCTSAAIAVAFLVLAAAPVSAARGESPAAFDGRCIPPSGVARRSNTPGILPPRALPAGRLARLGATRDFHHTLLAQGSGSGRASEPVLTTPDAPSEAKRAVLDVLRDPVFGVERDALEWRLKTSPGEPDAPQLPEWLRWIPTMAAFVATAGRYLVGVAAGVALAWLLVSLRQRRAGATALGVGAAPPAVLFGHDVRPESLPADVAASARQAALAGDVTGALALLYRGALVALVHRAGVRFLDGDTERDCLRRAGGALPGLERAYFGALVRSWQQAAYAHTSPHLDAVLGLCDEWPRSFAAPEPRT